MFSSIYISHLNESIPSFGRSLRLALSGVPTHTLQGAISIIGLVSALVSAVSLVSVLSAVG